MAKKRLLPAIMIFISLLLVFSSCNKKTEDDEDTTQDTQTEEVESETIAEEDKVHQHFSLNDGEDIFIPSLWLHYDGKKTNLLLNKATWRTSEGKDAFSLPGHEALFYANQMSPVEITGDTITAELEFTKEADFVVIHKWSGEYINNGDKLKDFEEIEVTGNKFSLSKNSVYEIFASFTGGTASYLVYVG